jgi:uncharacterized protein
MRSCNARETCMARVEDAGQIRVEVAYARADSQTIVELNLRAGAIVGQAIAASNIVARYPDIDLDASVVGVFGRSVTLDRLLRDGDRVEIYRPLLTDPKERRRRRAAQCEDAKRKR